MAADAMPERPALPRALVGTGVVAIARASSAQHVRAAVETLIYAGVTCVELTLTMPGSLEAIAALVTEFGDAASIGAGTVLTAAQARSCLGAGATFLVAPSAAPEVVELAVADGVPCLPGALTPSEIVSAWLAGAAGVKLFPASIGGPRYVRDVRAPLPEVALVPTGGIAIDQVRDYILAGATALGIGATLFGDSLDGGDLGALAERAGRFVQAVAHAREELRHA
jgi:2-dehydro-3-deoxyphosphogluconate aldolase / (4S)-4-hydroxy-2-oxoglutarate aldolase